MYSIQIIVYFIGIGGITIPIGCGMAADASPHGGFGMTGGVLAGQMDGDYGGGGGIMEYLLLGG